MVTHARKDFDAELAAWLAEVKMQQRDDVAEVDRYADLWLKAHEAAAIKDPTSPAAAEVHARIDGLLDGMGL